MEEADNRALERGQRADQSERVAPECQLEVVLNKTQDDTTRFVKKGCKKESRILSANWGVTKKKSERRDVRGGRKQFINRVQKYLSTYLILWGDLCVRTE